MNAILLQTIAKDLSIPKESFETEEEWSRRVLCSVMGLQMLTAAFGPDDDESSGMEDSVSMQKVLSRGESLSQLLGLPGDPKALGEEARKLYVSCGFMLHKSNRLAHPRVSMAKVGAKYVARGLPPWKARAASGLGMLVEDAADLNKVISIEKMFNLQEMPIAIWFEKLVESLSWDACSSFPQNAAYANIKREPQRGYFSEDKPPKAGIALCRAQSPGERAYALLRISDGLESCQLPQWRTENGEYRRITLALKTLANSFPHAKIKRGISAATLELDYLLPPAEQNFVELLSWSKGSQDLGGKLKRVIAADLLNDIKRLLLRFGYEIEEMAA